MSFIPSKIRNTSPSPSSFQAACQSGFSLLEVLISLLIFAVGFLGLASLQHVSLKLTHDASLHIRAVQLADSLVEHLRVQGLSADITSWHDQVATDLPDAQAQIQQLGDDLEILIEWRESQHSEQTHARQRYRLIAPLPNKP